MTPDPSRKKLAALTVAWAVVLALAIAGGGATNALLFDAETLGTANNPNVIAASGNIDSREVTPDGTVAPPPETTESANTPTSDCTGNTGNDGCGGGSPSVAVAGVPVMAALRRDRGAVTVGAGRSG